MRGLEPLPMRHNQHYMCMRLPSKRSPPTAEPRRARRRAPQAQQQHTRRPRTEQPKPRTTKHALATMANTSSAAAAASTKARCAGLGPTATCRLRALHAEGEAHVRTPTAPVHIQLAVFGRMEDRAAPARARAGNIFHSANMPWAQVSGKQGSPRPPPAHSMRTTGKSQCPPPKGTRHANYGSKQ